MKFNSFILTKTVDRQKIIGIFGVEHCLNVGRCLVQNAISYSQMRQINCLSLL